MKAPQLELLAILMILITAPAAQSAKLPIEGPMPSFARADEFLDPGAEVFVFTFG